MTDPSLSISRVEKDVQWLVQELGPRPARSSKARLAALGIRDRLKEAGWEPKVAQLANNIVACKGSGNILFLAHSDSVVNSPGAIDNAVGVAVLLELARSTKAENLCLGFPAQEEIGLIGSHHMASVLPEWHPKPKELQLVISLDLVGQGDLSITGLGQNWGISELTWLAAKGDITSQYGYQVVSRVLPSYERSDHASFANKGILAAQLLGSNQDGIFLDYHQKTDTKYDIQHIEKLLPILETMAVSPPKQDPLWKSGLLFQNTVLPFWIIWPVCLGAIALGIKNFSSFKEHAINLVKLLGIWIGWAIFSNIPLWLGFFSSSIEEINCESITGIEANGWWMWAQFYPLVFLVTLKSLQLLPKLRKSDFWKGSSCFWGGLLTLILFVIDPVLAFPMGVATLLSRIHPFFLAFGGFYWISGSILRQISFWGVLPPFLWFLPALLLIPAILEKK